MPIGRQPYVTYTLIAINVAVWVVGFGLDLLVGRIDNPFGQSYVAASVGALYGPLVARGAWWRLLTSGFLHSGLVHLAFNMVALVAFGPVLEREVGRLGFVAIYFTSLVAGSLGALLLSPGAVTLGASGAIFGVLGAILVGQRMAGVNVRSSGILALIVINLVFTVATPGISIGGHVGGLAGGVIGGLLLFNRRLFGRGPMALLSGTTACVTLGAILFAASLWIAANPVSLPEAPWPFSGKQGTQPTVPHVTAIVG
jgi:membrane associated rhomboid family serine protease